MSGIATVDGQLSHSRFETLFERLAESEGDREPWLGELARLSKADPKRVAAALAAWLDRKLGLPRADAKVFPLYHLLAGRWSAANRVAFEGSRGAVSFAQLDELVRWRVSVWAPLGVGPQKVVALGRGFGVELLLDLLAVFHLGACAAWLPPLGQPFEEAALVAVRPDFVCGVDELSAEVASKAVALVPPQVGPLAPSVRAPFDYSPNVACLVVVSPVSGDADARELPPPVAISAPELLLALGRDATLIWGLRAGEWLTAPGLDDRRHQPYLALSALLVGAGYQHLRTSELTHPTALAHEYRAFGVSRAARDALLGAATFPRVGRWFRVLEEVGEAAEWSACSSAMGIDKGSYAVAVDPGLGGVALAVAAPPGATAETRAVPSYHPAYPAFGVEWKLERLPAAVPDEGVGMLGFQDKRAAAPYLLVREDNRGLHWLDVIDLRRAGQVFPRGITATAVAGLPGVLGARGVALRKASTGRETFGLLVFVAASAGLWNDARRRAVQSLLSRHLARVLAAELRPDFIEVFPILPHFADGQLDGTWVEAERWSGGLERRATRVLFQRLAAIGLGG